jgi:hypothetical protein
MTWIYLKETKPEDFERILVCVSGDDGSVTEAYLRGGDFYEEYHGCDYVMRQRPTHWMPYPEAHK